MTPAQREQVKQLFSEVTALDAAAREAFLLAQRSVDSSVLAEVRSLLAHHSDQTLLVPPQSSRLTSVGRGDVTRLSRASRTVAALTRMPRLDARGYLALGLGLSALLIAVASYLSSVVAERTSQQLRQSRISSGLKATARALELWIEQEKQQAAMLASDPELRASAAELVRLAVANSDTVQLQNSPLQVQLRHQIRGSLGATARYALWDRRWVTLADWSEDGVGIGQTVSPYGASLLTRVFDGETVIQLPGIHAPITKGYPHEASTPRVGVVVPIRDAQQQVIAALLLYGVGGEERFYDILAIMQVGETGESYAFDRAGLMISESRFTVQLQQFGLLLDPAQKRSALNVYVRDPGGDLTAGYQPRTPVATWPLTQLVRFATRGSDVVSSGGDTSDRSASTHEEFDLEGYRSYRGTQVVGAWKWWPQYEFGLAMEIEAQELNQSLHYYRLESLAFLTLLTASLLGVIFSTVRLHRLRHQVERDRQLGQYTLEEQVGEGGMAVVYRARHALLKRPTAVKILKAEIANSRTMEWFEREVQLVSQLRHPNTIEVYDYGVTPEGLLYYVMEFLDGRTLAQLADQSGPLPVARALHLLRQIIGSLREAHRMGLVHRDIKPQNIMVCDCGGEIDFVKVLDFGLVKDFRSEASDTSTVLAGTPLYMAPERLCAPQQLDPRSDLYSYGAVAFFMLTARPIFAEKPDVGLLAQILDELPPRVSSCVATPIPDKLADLIERLLAKHPDDRPASADEVIACLAAIEQDLIAA